MTTVSVVYHTGTGHTGALAESIAKGASSVEGVTVATHNTKWLRPQSSCF
jgi:multimeric flavodoxin WrbA